MTRVVTNKSTLDLIPPEPRGAIGGEVRPPERGKILAHVLAAPYTHIITDVLV